jgi:transposase
MPWGKTDPVRERLRFVALHQEGLYSLSTLSARFGVSRQTGYATHERYEALGVDGLKNGSHAPLSYPHRIAEEVRALLVAAACAPKLGSEKDPGVAGAAAS